jgi:hypothetical protein
MLVLEINAEKLQVYDHTSSSELRREPDIRIANE